MGDTDAADPTELAPNETATESARAWGLDDYDDDQSTTRLTSGRITAAAVVEGGVLGAVHHGL